MKHLFTSLFALTLGCAPKTSTLASPVEQEPRARILADYLLEKGVPDDNLFCQGYTLTDKGETSTVTACYMQQEEDTMFADSLILSFSNKPFMYVDKKADDSLDEIILMGDVPINLPLEAFTEQDQANARSSYANVLEMVSTATFSEKK